MPAAPLFKSSYGDVIDRAERAVIFGFRCVLATQKSENNIP